MKENLLREKKEEFRCYFQNLWQGSKPLMKLFRTGSRGYLYDTGTNKIFACNDLEFTLLNNLMTMEANKALDKTKLSCLPNEFLQSLENLRMVISEKNVLRTKKDIDFSLSSHYKNLDGSLRNSLRMIQLEITERCNLRCGYCLYNSNYTEKRNHGIRDMSLDTAYQAIDYLAKNSRHQEDVAVAFYGGEPLLRFPFIQSCVQYARHKLKRKNLNFTITTNATLITPEISKYFVKEEFGIHASLDGPEDVHNQYRKDIHGIGSYQRTISGIKTLYDSYGDQKQKISLSMVYAPPFSEEKLNRISELWDECSWLHKDISLMISYARNSTLISSNIKKQYKRDFSLFNWTCKKFIRDYKKGARSHPIALSFIEKRLAEIHQRQIMAIPLNKYHLNGCCLPGVRKLFVSSNGTFHVCERIGAAPEIGNVHSGVDAQHVKKIYVKEYDNASLTFCSECWVLQLCTICYAYAFSHGRIDPKMKNEYCSANQEMTLAFLKLYCSLLEFNASGLDYLMDFQIQ